MRTRPTIIYIALLLLTMLSAGLLASCSDSAENGGDVAADCPVNICFTVAAAEKTLAADPATRAADEPETDLNETIEAGNSSLNENKIERLDLFVFNGSTAASTLEKHVSWSGTGTLTTNDNTSYTAGGTTVTTTQGTWAGTGLRTSAVIGKTVYLVANWSGAAGKTFIEGTYTVGDLAAETTDGTSFSPYVIQTSFLMDGMKANVVSDDITVTTSGTTDTGTLHIDIARAVAKIRLKVLSADETTHITTDITKSTTYRLFHYAGNGTVIDDGMTAAKSATATSLQSADAMAAYSNVVNDKGKAAFYSYPNYWAVQKDVRIYEPIDEDKQTYVLIYATYSGDNTSYYYKVPVNYRLGTDNDNYDTTNQGDWNKYLSKYESYYEMKRNHIYDVTVNIDRAGGTEPSTAVQPVLRYQAQDWDDKNGSDVEFN